jgi:EAL domain-containing protein (putative c-di-GMP-specific phosphodiesterase class I)
MTCQHALFEESPPVARPRALPQQAWSEQAWSKQTWFQPVVDTFDHRVAAHQCLLRYEGHEGEDYDISEAERIRFLAIEAAARHPWQGLYFFKLTPASLDNPERDMHSTVEAIFEFGLKPGCIAFEVAETDLIRDPGRTRVIRDYLRSNGFGFALAHVGTGAGAQSFQAVADFKPDYINLDRRLVRNFDKPVCAPTIGKLMRMAEKSGARVIADGVDRARTVENLWLLGVQFMQGNLFGKDSFRAA